MGRGRRGGEGEGGLFECTACRGASSVERFVDLVLLLALGRVREEETPFVLKGGKLTPSPSRLTLQIKEIHHLLNTHLSAPALPPTVLDRSQTYLLLSSSAPSKKPRTSVSASGEGKEYVIGACVVQRIQTGMRVLSAQEFEQRKEDGERLVVVDEQTADEHDGGVFCECVCLWQFSAVDSIDSLC